MKNLFEKLKKTNGNDIYLDYNIIIELEDLEKNNFKLFQEYLDILHQHNVYYSYGHLEELNTCYNKSIEEKKKRISFMERLTNNNEIICDPYSTFKLKKFVKIKENINDCFSRVDSPDKYSEFQDESFKIAHNTLEIDEIKNVNNIPINNFFYNKEIIIKFKEFLKKNKSKMELSPYLFNSLYSEAFNTKNDYKTRALFHTLADSSFIYEKEIIEDLLKVIKDKKIKIIKNKLILFKYTERLIELLFQFLYKINYFKEKNKKSSTYRSKVFDVTHCIFATQMDYFVTADKRLFYKMKVIFDFLDIKTKLILVKFENELTTNKIEVLTNE